MNRRGARVDVVRARIALALSLLLNFVFLVALYVGTRLHERAALPGAMQALQVRLIDTSEPASAEPSPPTAPASPRSEPVTTRSSTRAARRDAPVPREVAPPDTIDPGPTPRLFGADGRVLVPETHNAAPSASRDDLARTNPVPYTPTRFERAFTPRDETLGGEIVRRTTVSHTWRTPWGTQVKCVAVLSGLFGGCGWGFAPTAPIEELQAMRADPPMPRMRDDAATPDEKTQRDMKLQSDTLELPRATSFLPTN